MKMKPEFFIDLNELVPHIEIALAYATTDNFTGEIVAGYFNNVAYLTQQSAQALKNAQLELNQFNLGLKIFDAYRPVKAVEFFKSHWRNKVENDQLKKRFYPSFSKDDLFRLGYLATHSSHSRGSTIDLTLIELSTKNELDMGTEFDFFGEKSHTNSNLVNQSQKNNRLLLKSIMEKYHFINYEHEWWHFKLKNEPYPETYFDFDIKIDWA